MPLNIRIMPLYLYDNGEHHRAALGFYEEKFRDLVSHHISHIYPVDGASRTSRMVYRGHGFLAYLSEDIFGFPQIDKSSRDNVGRTFHGAGLAVNHGDDDKDAVLGEVLPVAQDHFSDISNSEAVHHNVVGGPDRLFDDRLGLAEGYNLAVFRYENVFFGHSHTLSEFCMVDEHGYLAVHGHKEFGAHELKHFSEFVLIFVPRCGNVGRGKDDGITSLDFHQLVFSVHDTH